jgi:outer membrane lipoprotein-sorting protein
MLNGQRNCKMTKSINIKSFRYLIGTIANLLISTAFIAEQSQADNLSARDIIAHMENAYANSNTYSDSGVVKVIFIGDVNQTVEKPFTTAFIRPDRFRYEFTEKKPYGTKQSFIIHLNGKNLQSYWDIQKDLKHDSLNNAVASATGVSNGSAITVPGMLMPNDITWRRAIRFSQPTRIDDDTLDNADCYRVQDLILGAIPTTLWIDKNNFMLRKIYREQTFNDFLIEETTIYNPNLNGEVSNDLLQFKPHKWKFW